MRPRLRLAVLATLLALTPLAARAANAPPPLTADDVRWLNRITYGIDAATVARYRSLGRQRYLEEQLKPAGLALPVEVAAALATTPSIEATLATLDEERKRIQALPSDEERQPARMALNQAGNLAAAEASRRHLLRALWSPAQVEAQMTWFWLNHFSVFQQKGDVRWMVADYEEQAIRPHALGRFRDLVLATVTHPAMLAYLDNAQNAAGKVNENYARELLELHTLGIDGGYGQQDVEALARVLTGVGLHRGGPPPRLKPAWTALYRSGGGFEFNPARHDFGEKVVLGLRVPGTGFDEVERVVALLTANPATARFICRKLATFWLGAGPPPALLASLSDEFRRTDGDVAAVLRVLFASQAFADSLGQAFKDPLHFVLSALRLAYDGKRPLHMAPAQGWLQALGEPLHGRITPDGYPLTAAAWTSPGQLARRFEIARAIAGGPAGLFDGEDGKPSETRGFPLLATRLYYEAVEPALSLQARQAQARAASQQEWNTFLLSSPDFMHR
jgi:uncharacterized protein (DUF1800 family)